MLLTSGQLIGIFFNIQQISVQGVNHAIVFIEIVLLELRISKTTN